MNFKQFLLESEDVKAVDNLLGPTTTPQIVADWLAEHGFPDAHILQLLRHGFTEEDLLAEAKRAYIGEKKFEVNLGYYGSKPKKLQWSNPIGETNWWTVTLSCHPEFEPVEAPAGVFIRRFCIRANEMNQGGFSSCYSLDSASSILERRNFSKNVIINCGLLLWAYVTR